LTGIGCDGQEEENEEEAVRLRDPMTVTPTVMLEVTVMGTTAPYW